MSLKDDLHAEVTKIFGERWSSRDGTEVPEPEVLKLSNDAVKLDGTVLYADLADSTELVNSREAHFAAEVYKTYLHCASKIIRDAGGVITAFDGDRVMGVFIGSSKNSLATKCALRINFAVSQIINPALAKQYPQAGYAIRHAVGIDTSKLFAARTGVRGANDLVWVGRAANYAAKLCSLRTDGCASWLTKEVYDVLNDEAKFSQGKPMWKEYNWTEKGVPVYGSTWWWPIA